MGIQLPQGFNIRSVEVIDTRLVLTKAQMKAMNDNLMPENYFAICSDDKKLYIYNKNNSVDTVIGKFRPLENYLTFNTAEAKAQFESALLNSVEFSTLKTNVGTVETGGLMKDVAEVKNDLYNEETGLVKKVADLKEEIEDPTSGLGARIEALEEDLTAAEARMDEIEERINNIRLENIPGTLNGGVVE